MNAKPVKMLGLMTLIAVIIAVAVLFLNRGPALQGGAGALLFPELADHLNSSAEISIRAGEQGVTLTREGDVWGVTEKSGYRADQEKVRAFLLGLARAEKVEPKTGNPDLYDRIGLGDQAVGLSLRDADDQILASLKTGNRQYDGGTKEDHTFILMAGEAESWLVSGLQEAETDPLAWLDKSILNLARTRIARVEISRDDEETYTLRRDKPDTYSFVLNNLADGDVAKNGPINSIIGTAQFLSFEDVAEIDDMVFTDPVTVVFHTFDGLAVRMMVARSGDDRWAVLTASHDPAVAEDEGAPEVMADVPEDGAGEAAGFNKLWAGRAYKISSITADNLTPRRADLVETAEEETETEK